MGKVRDRCGAVLRVHSAKPRVARIVFVLGQRKRHCVAAWCLAGEGVRPVTGAVAGTDYEVKLETNSDGGSRAEYKYKPQGVEDSEYTNTKPLAKRKYTVLVTIPETDTYEEKECFCDYTVSAKDPGESSVVIVDVYVGETYDPVLTTDSDGKADAVFEYKKADKVNDKPEYEQ